MLFTVYKPPVVIFLYKEFLEVKIGESLKKLGEGQGQRVHIQKAITHLIGFMFSFLIKEMKNYTVILVLSF